MRAVSALVALCLVALGTCAVLMWIQQAAQQFERLGLDPPTSPRLRLRSASFSHPSPGAPRVYEARLAAAPSTSSIERMYLPRGPEETPHTFVEGFVEHLLDAHLSECQIDGEPTREEYRRSMLDILDRLGIPPRGKEASLPKAARACISSAHEAEAAGTEPSDVSSQLLLDLLLEVYGSECALEHESVAPAVGGTVIQGA